MINYDEINLTAFCGVKTMDKLLEKLEPIQNNYIRAVKYEIVTIYESIHCEEGFISILKNDEYEKLEQYKKEQKELSDQLAEFNRIVNDNFWDLV